MLLHRNGIAILTAVRATGGHVLWMCPTLSFAIQWDLVQDFLSNAATLWLWVDTCRFDIDARETLIFATSSQGMLPLPSQCNHNSHLRMKGTHIKFPPNLCTRFVKLVAHFVCWDSRKLFALRLGAISPHLLPLSSLPFFLQTRSPLGRPPCCTGGEVGPLIKRPSHLHPEATVSRWQFLDAPRQSSITGKPFYQH